MTTTKRSGSGSSRRCKSSGARSRYATPPRPCSHLTTVESQVDAVGNIFATRPGTNNALPPIAMGSHLDTQPAGGKYDGLVGVHAALEVLKTLHEHGVATHAPLAVVDWTNEEGARFPPAMLGSGVWAGAFTPEYACVGPVICVPINCDAERVRS